LVGVPGEPQILRGAATNREQLDASPERDLTALAGLVE
jgi:hypothetical protein